MPTIIISVRIYEKSSFQDTHTLADFIAQDTARCINKALFRLAAKRLLDIFKKFNQDIVKGTCDWRSSDGRTFTEYDPGGVPGKPDP